MASYNSIVVTNKGTELINKALIESTNVPFTSIRTSDYVFEPGTNLAEVTELPQIKQVSLVSKVEILTATSIQVNSSVSNTNLTEPYYLRAIALYATDPDEGEILFAIVTAAVPDYIDVVTNINASSILVSLIVSISNSSIVSLEVNQGAYVTVEDLAETEENFNQKIFLLQEEVDENTEDLETVAQILSGTVDMKMFPRIPPETEDSPRIQRAIQTAMSSNKLLTSDGSAVYEIRNPLYATSSMGILYMNFNCATIKGIADGSGDFPENSLFIIEDGRQIPQGYIKNVRFDCNEIHGLETIRVVESRKRLWENIHIINMRAGIGVLILAGSSSNYTNFHLWGRQSAYSENVGFDIRIGDSHFNNIFMIDVTTAFINRGSMNYFDKCHAWLSANYLSNSRFMELRGGACFLTQCYPDTFQYAFYFVEQTDLFLEQCYCFINGNIYTSGRASTIGNPYVFFSAGANPAYCNHVSIQNSKFNGPFWGSVLNLHNFSSKQSLITVPEGNVMAGITATDGRYIRSSMSIASAEIGSILFNEIVHTANITTIQARFQFTAAINLTTNYPIGTIATNYRPAFFGGGDYFFTGYIRKGSNSSDIVAIVTIRIDSSGNIWLASPVAVSASADNQVCFSATYTNIVT